ncbi:MAG: Cof-type HAD-IIB family hydrolase [Treponema sp.]|jgi:Cof subfamily protein (haloacid dehalogenase superfamily)|nr:Cof-type HAD-IIB family hydrolase [Treponema sp.]
MNDIFPDPSSVQALALDLDGTALRPDTTMSDRTLRALKGCLDRGIAVIFCTGRAIEAAEPFRLPLGAEGPMVYFNGAEVVDMPGGKVLHATMLEREVVDFCVDLSRHMGVYYQVFFPGTPEYPRGKLMAERQSGETEMYRKHTGIQAVIGDLKEALAAPGITGCIKSMFLAEPEVQEALRPRLAERFGSRIYVARTLRTFLELMAAGVSKGHGLALALEHRGLVPEGVIALGDEENDLPLFEVAGFSVAPANAKDKVREAADRVIGSNAEDGVAVFLEEFLGRA